MKDENSAYREGDEKEDPAETARIDARMADIDRAAEAEVGEKLPEKPAQPEATAANVPQTAFLLMRLADGRVVVSTELPGFKMDHPVSLSEIRDMCSSAHDDVAIKQTSMASASLVSKALGQALAMNQRGQVKASIRN